MKHITWLAALVLAGLALGGPFLSRSLGAAAPSILVTRPDEAGVTLLTADTPGMPLRQIGSVPGVTANPRLPGQQLCVPGGPRSVVCLRNRDLVALDLPGGAPSVVAELPPTDTFAYTLLTAGADGGAWVLDVVAAKDGESDLAEDWTLGRVTLAPRPGYQQLFTQRHTGPGAGPQIVGESVARNLVYISPPGGDIARPLVLLVDRTTGETKGQVGPFPPVGENPYPTPLGLGPLSVSPDGRWLTGGSLEVPGAPATALPGYPSGVGLWLYDLDAPTTLPRGVSLPAALQYVGARWLSDGTALVGASASPYGQGTTTDQPGIYRLDPGAGTVTAGPAVPGQFAIGPVSPDGRWLPVITYGGRMSVPVRVVDLTTGAIVALSDNPQDIAVGWLQLP